MKPDKRFTAGANNLSPPGAIWFTLPLHGRARSSEPESPHNAAGDRDSLFYASAHAIRSTDIGSRSLWSLDRNEPDGILIRLAEIDSNYGNLLAQQELAFICHPDLVGAWRTESGGGDNLTRSIFGFGFHSDDDNNRHLKFIVLHGRHPFSNPWRK
jgi:hypothetical protein